MYFKNPAMLLSSLLLLVFSSVNAQTSNAILFTENGERFTVIMNGLRQNATPETNVKVEGLNANFYKLKIIFENQALGQANFNMGIEPGTETTYVIKQNNKNVYVLRPMSQVPIAQAPPSVSGSTVVNYNTSANPAEGETITQQTTTTTITNSDLPPSGVSIGMNLNDNGGSFSMNVNAMDAEETTVTTHQTTTVTTTTSSNSANTGDIVAVPNETYMLPGYNGPIGCPYPMRPVDFQPVKSTIGSKSFEESKLTIAKQILNNNCLLTDQVKEILMLFSFEDSKLDFAKYAYGRTFDTGNYYKVNDAFTFESSIEELNSYITSFRR
jgi:hypothetical protein